MAIEKVPLARVVHISMNDKGEVTHAWQEVSYSVQEDGAEIGRVSGGAVNVEPAVLSTAIPKQSDLIAQISILNSERIAAAKIIDELQTAITKSAE